MIRTQISLDESMYRQAREEASRQGISFAELCRRALLMVLRHRNQDKPWMSLAGAVDVDDPAASQTVDQVVYGRERP